MLELLKLPFDEKALEPYVSYKTVQVHYGKHHRGYVDKVNELIIGSQFQEMELEDIIRKTFNEPQNLVLYNNAGQVYSHNIYWQSFGFWNRLDEETKTKIMLKFGDREALKGKFIDEAMRVFGSGWVWLIQNVEGDYEIISTKNGDTPLPMGGIPLCNIDVWEHAYYLDYQNMRAKYVEEFVSGVLGI